MRWGVPMKNKYTCALKRILLCALVLVMALALAAMMLVVCAVFQTLLVRIDRENKALAAQQENA